MALACAMRLEHGELGIRRGAGADDGTTSVDLGGAAERRNIRSRILDRALEHIGDGHRAILRDESAMHAIALRPPFVFDDERALHGVEIGVAPAIEAKMPGNGTIESGNGERILDQSAAVGSTQLQRRIDERWPDRPPD